MVEVQAAAPATPSAFTLAKVMATINFSSENKDSLKISGNWPSVSAVSGQTATIAIGAFTVSFTLGANSKAKTGNATLSMTGKPPLLKFTLSATKQALVGPMDELGMVNANIKTATTLPFPVLMTVDGTTNLDTPTISYTAKANKSGTGKK